MRASSKRGPKVPHHRCQKIVFVAVVQVKGALCEPCLSRYIDHFCAVNATASKDRTRCCDDACFARLELFSLCVSGVFHGLAFIIKNRYSQL